MMMGWIHAFLSLWIFGSSQAMMAPGSQSSCSGGGGSSTTESTCPTAAFPSPFPSAFGVSRRIPALSVRGGEVLEPDSLQDVDAILMRAGSEGKLVVIDFSATWCGPCKQIAPLFKELSEAVSDVIFVKVDVDDNPDTAAKYQVSAMPTFLFIKAGEVVDRLMGASPARLQELIEEHK
jgi:thioredoxin 1